MLSKYPDCVPCFHQRVGTVSTQRKVRCLLSQESRLHRGVCCLPCGLIGGAGGKLRDWERDLAGDPAGKEGGILGEVGNHRLEDSPQFVGSVGIVGEGVDIVHQSPEPLTYLALAAPERSKHPARNVGLAEPPERAEESFL